MRERVPSRIRRHGDEDGAHVVVRYAVATPRQSGRIEVALPESIITLRQLRRRLHGDVIQQWQDLRKAMERADYALSGA
jgi:hypothetical protein